MKKAVDMGAEAACFGDIDIEDNRKWAEERCKNVKLESVFPLWHKNREENVYELIELGYKCVIKSINNTLLPKSLLGKFIDSCAIDKMKKHEIDICGENGEYHTLVVGGPIFHKALKYRVGEVMDFGDFSIVDIQFEE